MLVEFIEAFRFLARNPGTGDTREDLADPGILFWTMREYLILYMLRSVSRFSDIPTPIGRRRL
jgi:hypothetical protein